MTIMFECPVCKTKLLRAKHKMGNVWGCPACKGRVVNMALLRRSLDKATINHVWQATLDPEASEGKACPGCGKPMREVTAKTIQPPLKLDVCRFCQFIWFDADEFEQIPAAPVIEKPSPDDDLPPQAKEAFARMQVQAIQEKLRREDAEPDSGWHYLLGAIGLPVEKDTNPLQYLPWVTWLFCFTLLGVGIWSFQNLNPLIKTYGLIPAEALRLDGLTFITSFFLHAGWIHLLSNLYFFLIFGDNVEDALGPVQYILLLMGAALAGDILHIALDPYSSIPCIGASGGISGIIVFYALQFPHARLAIMIRYSFRYKWVSLPASAFVVIWIVLQIWGIAGQHYGFSHVSAMAHLGGALVGLLMWLIVRKSTTKNLADLSEG